MIQLVRVCAVIVGVMVLVITGVMVTQRGENPSWIAFVKDDDPDPMGYDYRVYLIDAETHATRRITQAELHDYLYLGWAPDGRSLIFESHRDNFGPTITPTGIFRLELSGRIEPIITEESLAWTPTGGNGAGQFYPWDRVPQLSPDGKWIAFGQSRGKKPPQAMVIAADHLSTLAEVKPLPLEIQYFYNRINMAWSPDGEWLAVISTASSQEGVSTSLYRVRRDGSAAEIVVEGNRDFTIPESFAPTWSPDGEWIAFVGRDVTETPDFTIYRVRADGSQLEQLVPDIFYMCDTIPWQPDSQWIIFGGTDPDYHIALYRVNVETLEMQQLPYENVPASRFELSPDGEWLAYVNNCKANDYQSGTCLFRIRTTGNTQERLIKTADAPLAAPPAWSPALEWTFRPLIAGVVGVVLIAVGVVIRPANVYV